MSQFEETIFRTSLQSFQRVMILMGIVCCLSPSVSKQDLSCRKLTTMSLHIIAIFSLVVYLIHGHLKNVRESIYNSDDTFTIALDSLGFSTLVMVQLIVYLESSWKVEMYHKIFNKFEQMRILLLEKFAIQFDYSRLKFYIRLLQIHFTINMILIICFVVVTFPPNVDLLLSMYAELVLKVKMFEFMFFVVVFMVMIFDVCRAARLQCRFVEMMQFASSAQRQECLMGFVALQDLHALLWENVQVLTNYFEWSSPGIFAKQLIDLTLLAYWAFLNTELGTTARVRYYLIVLWAVQIFTLTIACLLCSVCERWDRKLRSSFRNILKDRRNPLLMRCLNRISMQLWHEPISFEAGHFVTVNIGTLGKYIFTITMYIVILIQFRMSV
ncbi:putative gustatory receptor 98a [Anastrepha ludens]|uniref:putative gustatory receptor 98a n=1 Tax=Anastrepha ludens TaxID=28586 RepID=UPI0023AFF431|nr:putative gustatory receptor 98a [Anastrepha ludens]